MAQYPPTNSGANIINPNVIDPNAPPSLPIGATAVPAGIEVDVPPDG
jgi:hypothetical protein